MKYPIVLQDEIKDCGVSCILMLLKYYGGYVSKKNLIDMTKTSKNGTTAYHIKETLNNLGFKFVLFNKFSKYFIIELL